MTEDHWRRVDHLLQSAIDRDASQRASFLDEACAGDHALREHVEALLAADHQARDFLERPAIEANAAAMAACSDDALAGRRIGAYRIVRELGRGGMAAVYLAERADEQFRKQVAIKLVKPGIDGDAILHRFRSEREILAGLDHPHIAKLLDAGTTDDGLSYFIMEHVEGQPIESYCNTHRLSTRERLNLFSLVCAAVQHAHDHHVVHRDLKPSNILVTEAGIPKLLDFGIAKLLTPESAAATANPTIGGLRPMTPAYASPEQVRGEPMTPASDVYALGVLLYELLTGSPPYRVTANTLPEMARVICEHEPEKPSDAIGRGLRVAASKRDAGNALTLESVSVSRDAETAALRRCLTGDLDNIVLTALRKEPSRRYGSVAQFADDIRRHLVGHPVLARRDTLAYRTAKFVKRNKAAVVSATAAVLVTIAAVASPRFVSSDQGVSARAAPRVRSLAVLPLDNLSGDPEQDYFAAGMTEALISDLARIRALRVISRTSVMRYKTSEKSLAEIARELNVDAILEGAVQQSGERVRITAQLIDAAADRHLWNGSYERELRDVLALQGEVARAVVREIQVTVTPQEELRLASTRRLDPEAHRLYLWGRHHFNTRTDVGFTSAIQYFERAIERAPTYAAAYAGLAATYSLSGAIGYDRIPTRDAVAKARAAALKALQLDDSLAEAHAALAGVLMMGEWNWTGAEREFRRAIELNPGHASTRQAYSLFLTQLGRLDEALAEGTRAVEFDPLGLIPNSHLAHVFYYARRFDEALAQTRTVTELDPNYYGRPSLVRGYVLSAKGMHRDAINQYEKFSASPQGHGTYAVAMIGYARARAGDVRGALRVIEEILSTSKQRHVPAYHVAIVYIGLGDRDKAFAWLEKSYDAREPFCLWLKAEPLFDSLRSDPRFTDLARRVGLP